MALERRAVVDALLAERSQELLVVSSLGSPTWDVASTGNHAANFGFIGAMGQAAPFALGLALARPSKRVLVLVGDGELLMSLGVLATIANEAPKNLAVVVLDNERYGETGGQPTATAGRTDLEQVARGCGFEHARSFSATDDLGSLRSFALEGNGPVLAVAKVAGEALPLVFPHSFDGVTALNRFREAVLGEEA